MQKGLMAVVLGVALTCASLAAAEIVVTVPGSPRAWVMPNHAPGEVRYEACYFWQYGTQMYDMACHERHVRHEARIRAWQNPPVYNYPADPWHDQWRHEQWERRHRGW
jgi:hypothetical protein